MAGVTDWPHTWNWQDVYDDADGYYRGNSWNKKSLVIPKTDRNRIFLKFKGANQHTKVFVNRVKPESIWVVILLLSWR